MSERWPPDRLSLPLPLWLIIVLMGVGYSLTAVFFPLAPHFNRLPLPDVRTFTPSLGQGLLYALGLITLYWLYSQALRHRPPHLLLILVTAVLFALPLLLTFPYNATDIYRYFIRGRVSSIYDQNPFTEPPDAFPQDPFRPLAGEWSSETSPYGPLWELTAAAVTTLAQNNLYLGLILFKLLGLAGHLLIALLIWLLLAGREAAGRRHAALLWAWNPALLLTFVADAHNDSLMLLWLLIGLWVGHYRPDQRPSAAHLALSFTLMSLAPLTKPIGLLPLPFFFLTFWRQLPDANGRLRFLLLSTTGVLATIVLAFFPFGSPLALLERLAQEAGTGGGFSLTTLLLLLNQRLSGGLSWAVLTNVTRLAAGVIVLWLLWRTWHPRVHGGRSPLRATADIFALYIFQALNFRIWYSVWAVPWLILESGGAEEQGSRGAEEQRSGGAEEMRMIPFHASRLTPHASRLTPLSPLPSPLPSRPVSSSSSPANSPSSSTAICESTPSAATTSRPTSSACPSPSACPFFLL